AMYVYAAALKPEVERVIVVERAPEVIALIGRATRLATWPERRKVRILQIDALGPDLASAVGAETGGRRPDYLYADIWSICGAPEAPVETAGMVRALAPEAAGWWGQELSFGRWCRDRDLAPEEAALRRYAADVGVPIPIGAGYAAFCRDVVTARLPRRRSSGLGRLWRAIRSTRPP